MHLKITWVSWLLAVSLILVLTAGIASAATVTQNISYQGRLTTAAGSPLTGTYTITFRLYNVPTGGTALDTVIQDVKVSQGLFTTSLPFNADFYNGQSLWLGVKAGADAEMTPRQEIRPVPYALGLKPGAWITGTDSSSALNIRNAGQGDALNISTTEANSPGVNSTTAGLRSPAVRGESAQDIGVYGKGKTGGYFTTNADRGSGINVTMTYDGPGIIVNTSGLGHGMYVTTMHDSTPGLMIITKGKNSDGIQVSSRGGGSGYAIRAESSGSSYPAIFGMADNTGVTGSGMVNGVKGITYWGNGVYGESDNSFGIYGIGKKAGGFFTTYGKGWPGINVTTVYDNNDGVYTNTKGNSSHGINSETFGNDNIAVYARSYGSRSAGLKAWSSQAHAIEADIPGSTGNSIYTNDYIYAHGTRFPTSDVAEFMPVTGDATPGTVIVIGKGGVLSPSSKAYDTHVAGIVSTAPAVSLGTKEEGNPGEALIAVAGRVPCNVDASNGPVEEGDLLTTSSRPGYAMKATNPPVGTILGKAMGTLQSGTGTIDVLVTLQ